MGWEPIDGKNSTAWAISNLESMGALGGDLTVFDLVNRLTGRGHRMALANGGFSAGVLPFSASPSASDYTYFQTGRPVNFNDFDGKGARLTQAAFGIYSISYLTVWEGSAYAGPKLADVKMKGWGPAIPGGGSGHGVTKVIYGTGIPDDLVQRTVEEVKQEVVEEIVSKSWITSKDDDTINISSDSLFPFDRPRPGEAWVFDAKATAVLKVVAKLIRSRPERLVEAQGFTDSIGPDDYNLLLSERRAKAVAHWLTTVGGVKSISSNGLGKDFPVVPNKDTSPTAANIAAQAKNRRVEILLHKPIVRP